MTDGLNEDDAHFITQTFAPTGIELKLIAVGTSEGALVRLPDGQILRHKGQVVTPTVPLKNLQQITQQVGGDFYTPPLSPKALHQLSQLSDGTQTAKDTGIRGNTWREQGHWLALPFLLWLLWQFRGGAILLFLAVVLPYSPDSQASLLHYFKTDDQKAQQAANDDNWPLARELFTDPKWQAASLYATESYQAAAERLAPIAQSAQDFYNLGNSRALANDLQGAITAYKNALEKQPDLEEARENLNYLEAQLAAQQSGNNTDNKQDDSETSTSEDASENQQSGSQPNEDGDPSNQKRDNSAKNTDNQSQPSDQSNLQQPELSKDIDQEERQALEQWLRQIQDDPGTLLQRKLWHLHQQRRNENRYNQEDGQQPW